MSSSNLHSAWARLFIRALARSSLRNIVLSPGSRSTPLALAAVQEEAEGAVPLVCHTAIDERSAAFFALGQARATGLPTALICTSGTAGAHYFPAIIEASQSHVPLVVITADRPWELVDVAASQTINQLCLFGDAVRHFAELGLPDPSPLALRAVPRIAAQAVSRSLYPLPGPVHINARFRKPLEPVSTNSPESWEPLYEELLAATPTRVFPPRAEPSPEALEEISARVPSAKRGLIVCGPSPIDPQSRLGRAAHLLSIHAGFPILAEATSQVRYGAWTRTAPVCAAFDALLRVPSFRAAHAPDLLIEIGAPPTSQGYAELLAATPRVPRYVLAPHGWNDPAGTATALVHGDPASALETITRKLGELSVAKNPAWKKSFVKANNRALNITASLRSGQTLTEGDIAHLVVDRSPDDAILMIGNSMPVRDVDTWAGVRSRKLDVLHQRGASGIDGLVSGAAGALCATGRPVTLLLGDLSLLHDLGGLALARRVSRPLVIVVVQNAGGRIFETLPVVHTTERKHFDKCFTMPEPVDLNDAARAFGVGFIRANAPTELSGALDAAWSTPSATLIEAVVPPGDGASRLARLRADLSAALSDPRASRDTGAA